MSMNSLDSGCQFKNLEAISNLQKYFPEQLSPHIWCDITFGGIVGVLGTK